MEFNAVWAWHVHIRVIGQVYLQVKVGSFSIDFIAIFTVIT